MRSTDESRCAKLGKPQTSLQRSCVAIVCRHRSSSKIAELPERVAGCEDCRAAGTSWLHLGIWLGCDHVECSDDSPQRQARAHADANGHPIIRSLEPDEEWSWCYVDRIGMLTSEITDSPRTRAAAQPGRRCHSRIDLSAVTSQPVAALNASTAANALPRIVAPWRLLASTGSTASVTVTRFSDPLCPWDYSFEPTMRTLESRYGDQLKLRTVVIGLVTDVEDRLAQGYSPEHAALVGQRFGHLGMPFTPHIRARAMASAPACQIVKAAGLQGEELAEAVLRALRFAWFNTPLLLDETESLEAVCERIDGLDMARAIVDLDNAPVAEAYLADRNEARSPSHISVSLRRAANTDGLVRYTAPSLVLSDAQGKSMIVPGFQPFEAVDVAIVNLEPNLRRLPVPRLEELLALYPGGLTSQEVARVLADTTTPPDRAAGEAALAHLVATGHARRTPIGDDALWTTA